MKRIVFLWGGVMAAGVVGADTFTSVTNGLWHVPATWGQAVLPGEADVAVIETYSVSLNQNAHVELLSVGSGVLDAAGHTLVVDSTTDVYGSGILRGSTFDLSTFTLSGGTVDEATVNANVFNWSGGRADDSQLNVTDGTFSYSGSSPRYLHNSSLGITGDFTQSGTGLLRLDGASSVIENGGTWDLTTDAKPFIGTGHFENRGTFKKSAGSGANDITVPFYDYAGTLQVDSGSIDFEVNPEDAVFSNTTFSIASGSSAFFPNGANFSDTITGSGGGTLSLGWYFGTTFDFTNDCSITMGSGGISWNVGQFNGNLTTLSRVDIRTTGSHSVYKSRWIATGGARHITATGVNLTQSVLEIPTNATYELQTNGTHIIGSTYSYVDLAGTISKTKGAGTSIISAAVRGDGAMLNVSTGVLSLAGSGRLENLEVYLAEGTTWRPGGINSNVTVAATGTGSVHFYNSDATAAGRWSMTHVNLNAYFGDDGDILYVTPSLTLEGTNSSFRFSKGQIRNGIITSRIPFEVTSSGGDRLFSGCQFHNEAEADFYRSGTSLTSSSWRNQSGAVHRVHVDGSFLSGTTSFYYNQGTFRKVAGSGTADSNVRWIDTDGILAVDEGTLALCAQYNQFSGTHVALASGTVFQMSGTLASNMTVEAVGPATVRLAANGWDQSGLYDLPLTGPVTLELVSGTISMTGTISGAEAVFEWRGGRIENSRITNTVPSRISGSGTSYVNGSHLYFQADTLHTNRRISLQNSRIYNETGATYRLVSDGELIYKSGNYGYFSNFGTLLKTGGAGTTEMNAVFENQGGIVGAERGTLQFGTPMDLTDGGLQIALGGTSDYGRVKSLATVTADGTLTVTLRDGYTPATNDSFIILSGSSLSGIFSSNNLPALSPELAWNLDYGSAALTLSVATAHDSDSDGLGDDWERRSFSNLTTTAGGTSNIDNDPHTDQQEYIADTLGGDSNDYFRVTSLSNGVVYFDSSSNRFYTLLGCTNLLSNDWKPVQIPRMGTGGADFLQSTNNVPQEFYKLTVELP